MGDDPNDNLDSRRLLQFIGCSTIFLVLWSDNCNGSIHFYFVSKIRDPRIFAVCISRVDEIPLIFKGSALIGCCVALEDWNDCILGLGGCHLVLVGSRAHQLYDHGPASLARCCGRNGLAALEHWHCGPASLAAQLSRMNGAWRAFSSDCLSTDDAADLKNREINSNYALNL